ncbi:MAG: PQQ-binding-like beta-propeller repeat protein [Thermoplasmata archaeon]|nr:PQQ-binding-like beta-propeller repeat protein [Thermoplasmata archaeon]
MRSEVQPHRIAPVLALLFGICLALLPLGLFLYPGPRALAPPQNAPGAGTTRIVADSGLVAANFGNWAVYGADSSRSGVQPLERTLSVSNASLLTTIVERNVSGPVAGSIAVANGTAYFGSWDGSVRAFNTTNQNFTWSFSSTNAPATNCTAPSNSGVTSTPAVWNNLVIVGTGDPRHTLGGGTYHGYGWVVAINATGTPTQVGKALWGTNLSLTDDDLGYWNATYIWSSPFVYQGNIYIGFASSCDGPLVQGQLDELKGSTGQLLHTFDVVNNSWKGGDVWSSPVLDAKNGTIWITTGNPYKNLSSSNYQEYRYTEAIVALNASNISQVLGYWNLNNSGDYDFGSGVTLFTGPTGTPLVGAQNKDGSFYAFDRSSFHGHVTSAWWTKYVGRAGTAVNDISPATFANGQIYVGNDVIYSFTPGHSTPTWSYNDSPTGRSYTVLGALTYADGLLIAGLSENSPHYSLHNGTLVVLNAATGKPLYFLNLTGSIITGQPVVADGRIYFGTAGDNFQGQGRLYELGIPLEPAPAYWQWASNGNGSASWESGPGGGAPPYACSWTIESSTFTTPPPSRPCVAWSTPPYSIPSTGLTLFANETLKDSQAGHALFPYVAKVSPPVKPRSTNSTGPCVVQLTIGQVCEGGSCTPIYNPYLFLHLWSIFFNALVANGTLPYSFTWNFGDGSSPSHIQNPAHTYSEPGEYLVTMTVADAEHHSMLAECWLHAV